MISLIGPAASTEYDLPIHTAAQQKLFDELYDTGRLSELVDPHGHLHGLSPTFPVPPTTDWPRPRLGMIHWPVVGCARYAFGTLLVDEFTLGQLRAQMISAGSNIITVRLRDDPDNAGEVGRDVPLRFLSSRPLVRTTTGALTVSDDDAEVDAWVITLVDERYELLHNTLTSLTGSSWSAVFAAGGVSITDAVNASYLTPSARWQTRHVLGRSVAWLMDVAAISVGSRIVSVPGVGPALQRPTGTHALTLAVAHALAEADFRHVGGGPIEDADVDAGIPNTAQVVFGTSDEVTPVKETAVIQVAILWGGGAAISHWCDAPASTGAGARTTLAAQFVLDWGAWQYNVYDTLYDGFLDVPASGFLWAVEWEHTGGKATTRFVRPPHWYNYLLGVDNAFDVGCGLSRLSDGTLVSELGEAGHGLEVEIPEEGCNVLNVKIGCGIKFDDDDAVAVDAAGLIGCGLKIQSEEGECDKIAVDYAQLAGDYTETALVDLPGEEETDCHTLGVDLVEATTTSEYRVNDVTLTLVGNVIRMTKIRTRSTNSFNAAGLLINRVDNESVTSVTDIDLCAGTSTCSTGWMLAKTLDDVTCIATYEATTRPPYVLASTLDNATLVATYTALTNGAAYELYSTLDNATLVATYTALTNGAAYELYSTLAPVTSVATLVITTGSQYQLASTLDDATLVADYTSSWAYELASTLAAATLSATYTATSTGPGSTCDTAASTTVETLNSATSTALPGQWWTITGLVNGTTYYLSYSPNGTSDPSFQAYQGGSCPSPSNLLPFFDYAGCYHFTSGTGQFWINFSSGLGGATPYSWKLSTTPC